jgi:hypothetical protein
MRFSPSERSEISGILQLARAAPACVGIIEEMLTRSRKLEADEAAEFSTLRRHRGRPGLGVGLLQDLASLAFMYEHATGAPMKNSNSRLRYGRTRPHPFYRLAQICLRKGDPSGLIALVRGSYWPPDPRGRELVASWIDCCRFVEALKSARPGRAVRKEMGVQGVQREVVTAP